MPDLVRQSRKQARPEDAIVNAIRVELGATPGLILWRNGVGFSEVWDETRGTTRKQRFGLERGSADLIGVYFGRFLALEVKQPGAKATAEQLAWLAKVHGVGGFGCVVHSVEEAWAALDRCWIGARE
jgi:hypothetical protein